MHYHKIGRSPVCFSHVFVVSESTRKSLRLCHRDTGPAQPDTAGLCDSNASFRAINEFRY